MRVRSLGWRTDLALLRLADGELVDRGDHLVARSPANPHFWWGNFLLLDAAPDDPAAWVERFAVEFPAARHVTLGVDDPRGTAQQLAWYASHGFEADAAAVLTAAQVHPPRSRNDAAECRPLAGDADWAASRALAIASDDTGVAVAEIDAFCTAQTRSRRRLTEAGHGRWFGAFLDGRLVSQLGLVDAGDGLARFQSVETDPAHFRRGLAGTLVHHAGRWGLDELGARTLVMIADPGYWAIDLYRRVGFTVTESHPQVQRKPSSAE